VRVFAREGLMKPLAEQLDLRLSHVALHQYQYLSFGQIAEKTGYCLGWLSKK
jgi:hypothetical protein